MITFPFSFFTFKFDPAAKAFIDAAGITNTDEQYAINDLVIGLKNENIWNDMSAIYPVVGGSASSQKYNLKDPRDLDAAYRLNFVGGWTHNSSGMTPNGTTGYANTFANLASNSDFHISFYSDTNSVSGNKVSIGARDGSSNEWSITICRVSNTDARGIASNSGSNDVIDYTNSPANSSGYYVWTTAGSTTRDMYKNGSALSVSSTASFGSTAPNRNFYIGALNLDNTADLFDTKKCQFATIGNELTSTQITALNTLVQDFQTALGR
jgi:hypothetical protein